MGNVPCFDDLTNWLLKAETPSIRFLTRNSLASAAPNSSDILPAQTKLAVCEPLQSILDAQHPEGFWFSDRNYYGPKYRSSHWSMLLQTELAVHPDNQNFQTGASYMLERVFQTSPKENWLFQGGTGCFWGNWLRYQLYAGNFAHARVQEIIDRTCADIHLHGKCRYNNNLDCAWGVIRDLFGLALIPIAQRNRQVRQAIETGVHFLLADHDLLQADYAHIDKIHPTWFKLSFPLFYQADVLFVLRVIKELGTIDHPGANTALEWLRRKQGKNGKWRGGSPYRARTWQFTSGFDTVNHWLTLQALQVLSD